MNITYQILEIGKYVIIQLFHLRFIFVVFFSFLSLLILTESDDGLLCGRSHISDYLKCLIMFDSKMEEKEMKILKLCNGDSTQFVL